VVPGPDTGPNWYLFDVEAVAPDDVWAVGNYQATGVGQTLVMRWNGSQWSVVPSPNTGSGSNLLYGVNAVPGSLGQVWAVGNYRQGEDTLTLIERFEPPSFSDVLPPDYFYEPVRYLACQGAISGYADDTFRPYNNTTRAQLTKIVTLAEVWPLLNPPTPHFSDVPADHPFYGYIETAFDHGIISGYADGTFRPYNDVTRSQLTKIVVLAEGWPLYTPPAPTFTDVPTDHPFYTYVETAYYRGIISGYADRTFRPYNNATRGQISKIVYLAVTAQPAVTQTPTSTETATNMPTFTFTPTGTPTNTPAVTQTPVCGLRWRTAISPNPGAQGDFLASVDAVSADDIWAVGSTLSNGISTTLTMHWNGAQWSTVPSPNGILEHNRLTDVDAVSANDVWAVGFASRQEGIFEATRKFVLHWNGTDWSLVTTPYQGGTDLLNGVDAVSANDVWVVGAHGDPAGMGGYVMHWDGTNWSTYHPTGAILYTVSGTSASDVWAAGASGVMLRWDGFNWYPVSTPNPGGSGYTFTGVEALSANDAWAVGYSTGAADRPFAMHWNGTQWSLTELSGVPGGSTRLQGVVGVSTNDVWAVGYGTPGNPAPVLTLIEHWDGTQWTAVAGTNADAGESRLYGVAAQAPGNVWAVGQGNTRTLVERYSDPCAGYTATRTPTGPTGTATGTPTITRTWTGTPPTATRTGTPTRTPTATATGVSCGVGLGTWSQQAFMPAARA
jgi:hypothetical protein